MEEFIITIIGWLPDSWGVYVTAVISVIVSVSALFCTFLKAPTESSSTAYKVVYTVLQWCALNLGKAKNAQDITAASASSVQSASSGDEK